MVAYRRTAMLTRRQKQLLDFIVASDPCPTYDEMASAMGFTSKSGIHRLLKGLEERKFVRRIPNRARAIEVLSLPGEPAPIVKPVTPDVVHIPLYGRIS